MEILALACYKMKNISTGYYKDASQRDDIHHGTVYITI